MQSEVWVRGWHVGAPPCVGPLSRPSKQRWAVVPSGYLASLGAHHAQ